MIDARHLVTKPQGSQKNPNASVLGIAVHHSVSGDYLSEDATEAQEIAHIKAIDSYHLQVGFGMFGYHMAAFPSGRLYLCGDLDGQRAHVAGRNHQLRGIVAIGTFTDRLPGPRQVAAIVEGIREIRRFTGRPLPVKGHNDWALPGNGSACAGRMNGFDWEPLLQGDNDVEERKEIELANHRARGYLIDALHRDYIVEPVAEPGPGMLTVELLTPTRQRLSPPVRITVPMRPEVIRGQ